jgi:hypothetical protein
VVAPAGGDRSHADGAGAEAHENTDKSRHFANI